MTLTQIDVETPIYITSPSCDLNNKWLLHQFGDDFIVK